MMIPALLAFIALPLKWKEDAEYLTRVNGTRWSEVAMIAHASQVYAAVLRYLNDESSERPLANLHLRPLPGGNTDAKYTDNSCVVTAQGSSGVCVLKVIPSSASARHRHAYEEVYPAFVEGHPAEAMGVAECEFARNVFTVGPNTHDLVVMPYYPQSLLDFVRGCREKQNWWGLRQFAFKWRMLEGRFDAAKIVHGDLHHKNIRVLADGSPVLIDLDTLAKWTEPDRALAVKGDADYQHAMRFDKAGDEFFRHNPQLLDRFPHWCIYIAILTFADPRLAEVCRPFKQKLLLEADDFVLDESDSERAGKIFYDLERLSGPGNAIHKLAKHMRGVCERPLAACDFLSLTQILQHYADASENYIVADSVFTLERELGASSGRNSGHHPLLVILINQGESMTKKMNGTTIIESAAAAIEETMRYFDARDRYRNPLESTGLLIFGYHTGPDNSAHIAMHLTASGNRIWAALNTDEGRIADGDVARHILYNMRTDKGAPLGGALYIVADVVKAAHEAGLLSGPVLVLNLTDGNFFECAGTASAPVANGAMHLQEVGTATAGVFLAHVVWGECKPSRSLENGAILSRKSLEVLTSTASQVPGIWLTRLKRNSQFQHAGADAVLVLLPEDLSAFLNCCLP